MTQANINIIDVVPSANIHNRKFDDVKGSIHQKVSDEKSKVYKNALGDLVNSNSINSVSVSEFDFDYFNSTGSIRFTNKLVKDVDNRFMKKSDRNNLTLNNIAITVDLFKYDKEFLQALSNQGLTISNKKLSTIQVLSKKTLEFLTSVMGVRSRV
tara:strand:+ start:81 stop:545 length:465 start_codon:yes stop_codon:yes gene_type:complete